VVHLAESSCSRHISSLTILSANPPFTHETCQLLHAYMPQLRTLRCRIDCTAGPHDVHSSIAWTKCTLFPASKGEHGARGHREHQSLQGGRGAADTVGTIGRPHRHVCTGRVKRQLVACLDSGAAPSSASAEQPQWPYDVFHLPFKVVRDDSVDPRSWDGGGSAGLKSDPTDARAKQRVRGVLQELMGKYREEEEKMATIEEQSTLGVHIPASPASSPAALPSPMPPAPVPSSVSFAPSTKRSSKGSSDLCPASVPHTLPTRTTKVTRTR
jgi:hypothetical protein